MKEYQIEKRIQEDEEENLWMNVDRIYTDWVEVAVAYKKLQLANPHERFRICSRKVTYWDECYRG